MMKKIYFFLNAGDGASSQFLFYLHLSSTFTFFVYIYFIYSTLEMALIPKFLFYLYFYLSIRYSCLASRIDSQESYCLFYWIYWNNLFIHKY